MIRAPLQSIIRRLKRDPHYCLEDGLSVGTYLAISLEKLVQVIRGLFIRTLRARGLSFPTFAHRGLEIRGGGKILAGPCLTLERHVCLRARSVRGIKLGRNVTIARDAILQTTGVIARPGEGIELGDNVAVGAGSFLGGQGGLCIGSDTIMGPGVRIFSEDHVFDHPDVLIRSQGEIRAEVRIGRNCWIGANAVLLAGTTLEDGCVVGAGAVVKGIFPKDSLVLGAPAKVKRRRTRD